jgi:hypothetical protein
MKKLLNIRIAFALFMLVVFAYGAYGVKNMVFGARIFPISVAAPGVLLVLIQLYREVRRSLNPEPEGTATAEERVIDVASDTSTSAAVVYARGLQYLSWLVGLYVGIYLIGFKMSIPIYIVLFMRVEGKAPWKVIIPITGLTLYIVYFHFQKLLGVYWPDCLLNELGWINIPWLFQ